MRELKIGILRIRAIVTWDCRVKSDRQSVETIIPARLLEFSILLQLGAVPGKEGFNPRRQPAVL